MAKTTTTTKAAADEPKPVSATEPVKIEVYGPSGAKLVLTAEYSPAEDTPADAPMPDKVRGFLNTLDSSANAALR